MLFIITQLLAYLLRFIFILLRGLAMVFVSDEKRREILIKHKQNGVILESLDNIYIDESVIIESGAVIYANNHISDSSYIASGAKILPYCNITNSKIGENSQITSSTLDSAEVGKNTKVGPNAYLRPQSKIGNDCKIGDFVEVKNATIADGTKASHLSYIGDADVGENCNIGCGVIFVNYNGRSKNRTKIGDNVFVGSNSNIIAPVTTENNVYICAGTTVTSNLNENDFVIGRSRETIKPNKADKYLKK